MKIGNKIKKIREFKSITQEWMAQELDISQPTYSRIEKDEGDRSLHQLDRIAAIFGMKPEEIMMFDEKVIFTINNSPHSANSYTQTGDNHFNFPENLKKLYEENAELLKNRIKQLEDENSELKRLTNK